MTIKKYFQHLQNQLSTIYEPGEAESIAALVMEHYLGISRTQLRLKGEDVLQPTLEQHLAKATTALLKGKPVQYVLAEAWFCNMPFYVDENVLIPRPETEELVQWLIKQYEHLPKPIKILEIGTGSGCIAIALKKVMPNTTVTAIEISEGALKIAKKNAASLETNIDFLLFDFLNEDNWIQLSSFDIVISNPPYIPFIEKASLDLQVAEWEPSLALFVPNNDALLFYKKIALFAKSHLNKNGRVFVECHQHFAKATEAMFMEYGYKTELRKDIFDNERMLNASID